MAILKAALDRAWAGDCDKPMLMTGSKKPSTLALFEARVSSHPRPAFRPDGFRSAPDKRQPAQQKTPALRAGALKRN